MHRCPGSVHNRADTGTDLALAEEELELAFEDVVGLILGAVQVRSRPASGGTSTSKIPTDLS